MKFEFNQDETCKSTNMPLGRHQNEAERIVLAISTGTKVHSQ